MHLQEVVSSTFFEQPHDSLLQEIADVQSVSVSASTKVGYLLLNRHLLGEAPAIVSVGGFLSDVTTADRAWEGVNLASLQRPVLMLDIPGHGLSSPHNSKQIIDLCIKRTPTSEAAPLIDAVQKLLPPQDDIDYFGISHGSLLGLVMTAMDPNDRVCTAFCLDLPAVKKRSTLGLQAGYIVADSLLGYKKYVAELQDTEVWKDFEKFKLIHEKLAVQPASSFIKNNFGLFVFNLFASVNARPAALQAWQEVLDNKSGNIRVVTSEKGSVSDPAAIDLFIQSLPMAYQIRSIQRVIAGEDHNIGRTPLLPRAVMWAREAYATV